MSATAWAIIAYIAFDRLLTVAMMGRSIEITRIGTVATLITGTLIVLGVVSLAGCTCRYRKALRQIVQASLKHGPSIDTPPGF